MAFSISVSADTSTIRKFFNSLDKQSTYAAAVALTRTAQDVQRETIKTMRTKFDRPTRYALGATRLIPATKQRLIAQVLLKDRRGAAASKQSSYLFPQVFGGPRGRKAYETALLKAGVIRPNEFTVPARGWPLDAFGNISVGQIKQVLSQLKAAESTAGFTANKSTSARSRRAVRKAGTYFVPAPGSGLPRGIYQRVNLGSRWGTRMILKIVTGKPTYKTRLPLGDIGNRVAAKVFQRHYDIALAQARATAR